MKYTSLGWTVNRKNASTEYWQYVVCCERSECGDRPGLDLDFRHELLPQSAPVCIRAQYVCTWLCIVNVGTFVKSQWVGGALAQVGLQALLIRNQKKEIKRGNRWPWRKGFCEHHVWSQREFKCDLESLLGLGAFVVFVGVTSFWQRLMKWNVAWITHILGKWFCLKALSGPRRWATWEREKSHVQSKTEQQGNLQDLRWCWLELTAFKVH